jgi:hypothetical protein
MEKMMNKSLKCLQVLIVLYTEGIQLARQPGVYLDG